MVITQEMSVQKEEGQLTILGERMRVLHNDVADVKTSVNRLTEAITKLALIEERQIQYASAMERAFQAIKGLEDRMMKLENLVPANKRITRWVDNAVIGAFIIIAMTILRKTGMGD